MQSNNSFLIRQKHTFKYHGQEFYCSDLSVEDFLHMSIDPVAAFEKIISEHNDEPPRLNARQYEQLMKILSVDSDDNFGDLFKVKTQKKTDPQKALQDFHISELKLAKAIGQPISEIRQWNIKYLHMVWRDIDIIVWNEKYNANRYDEAAAEKQFLNIFANG